MEFVRDYFVHYYEADSDKHLALTAMVHYFEDIAILHSTSCGLDLAYFEKNMCGWMLLKWDIQIHSLPTFGETVRIATKVHALKRFLAERVFTLSSADGTVLVRARSNWLLADTVKRRPLRVPEEQYSVFGVTKESETSFVMIADVPSGLLSDSGKAFSSCGKIRSCNSDIDTNCHVNNVSYLSWALDSLDPTRMRDFQPVSIRIHYKKELNLGDEGEIHTRIGMPESDGRVETSHAIVKDGEEFCCVVIGWKGRAGIDNSSSSRV